MKLGILVVYMLEERDERLLDLHLNRIEANTAVPYKIYGIANELLPQFEKKLDNHPKVEIYDCPSPEPGLGGSRELAFYLNKLIDVAINEDVTHICTLHPDSFPVKLGWAGELADNLSEDCPLTGIMRHEKIDRKPMTACIYFRRNFYLKYKPSFLLSPEILSSEEFSKYKEKFPIANPKECGVGYGYKIYQENLDWEPLSRSNETEAHHYFGGIYGDKVFHLGAANFPGRGFPGAEKLKARKALSFLLPQGLKDFLRRLFPLELLFSDLRERKQMYEKVRKGLLKNPESFIETLRSGEGGNST